MESTRSQRTAKAREAGYSRVSDRNYTIRNKEKDNSENGYKKSIFTLQIIICLGLFTGALLIRTINTSFTEDMREKIKTTISENIPIGQLYNKVLEKLGNISDLKTDGETETQAETKKKSETSTPKLVPTLEE